MELIKPMLAENILEPFNKTGWLFENKFDGVRAITYIENGLHTIYGRSGANITLNYPEFHDIAKYFNIKNTILDGEIVVLDKNGNPDFQQLQHRINLQNQDEIERLSKEQRLRYYIFDILKSENIDLKNKMLYERKDILEKSIKSEPDHIKISDYVIKNGIVLFNQMQELGLEGIVAKNGQSFYKQNRSKDWLKIKVKYREEVIICGFTEPKNSREYFGALVLGLYNNGNLQYIGKVGTGFTMLSLGIIYNILQKLILPANNPLFKTPINESITWIKPIQICEVEFANWTENCHMRHPVFMGLREDKNAMQCIVE